MLCYIDGISWFQIALQEKPLLSTIMQSRQPFHWATNLHIQPHKHIQTSHITREVWLWKGELWSELEFLYFPIPTRLDPVPVTFLSRPSSVSVPNPDIRRIALRRIFGGHLLSSPRINQEGRDSGLGRDRDGTSQGFGTWTGLGRDQSGFENGTDEQTIRNWRQLV